MGAVMMAIDGGHHACCDVPRWLVAHRFDPIAPATPKPGGRRPKFAPTPSAPKNITSRVDESNIIPEGVKRARQPTNRREAYAVALSEVNTRNAYHSALSAHIASSQY